MSLEISFSVVNSFGVHRTIDLEELIPCNNIILLIEVGIEVSTPISINNTFL